MAANIITTAISKALSTPAPSKKRLAQVEKKAELEAAAPLLEKLEKKAAAELLKEEPKVRVAWNAGKVVVHHAVRVGEATFTSTWKAFETIPELTLLSRGQHIKFRKALKLAGKLDFKDPKSGKVFPFEIIAE